MPIIAVISYKGGVGKTQITVNLAAALRLAGVPLRIVAADKDQAVLNYAAALPDVEFIGAPGIGAALRTPFDGLTLIDGPPALLESQASSLLRGCDGVLIPSNPGSESRRDAADLCRLAVGIGKTARVVMTRYDSRGKSRAERLESLRRATLAVGGGMFETIIPAHTAIEDAEEERTTIFHVAPRSRCAAAHRALATEVMELWHYGKRHDRAD